MGYDNQPQQTGISVKLHGLWLSEVILSTDRMVDIIGCVYFPECILVTSSDWIDLETKVNLKKNSVRWRSGHKPLRRQPKVLATLLPRLLVMMMIIRVNNNILNLIYNALETL